MNMPNEPSTAGRARGADCAKISQQKVSNT